MRIVAIGLGGAGCRIVDRLYATDRKSSKIACVQGLAVDVDEESLKYLKDLPDSAKLYFPPLDPQLGEGSGPGGSTASIDINEIISRIQNFEYGETDAIFVCLGLGGSLTDVAPHIISRLRSAISEPIFGLVTLPCLAEGEKRSSKAADGIDMLSPILDGMILFDNETWYKKTATLKAKILNREKGLAERLGFGKQEPEMSPRMVTYLLLNDSIVRRISLILRAGEFRADGGIDLAEVVLDSGEVLNTMKGMGFITIGYAVDHIPQNPLGFLSQWRPKGIFDEENKKKASRIVDLAKQAIYHEISTPCDMTSAHKALILVAGPTHELSMMGFMTVRKWIDRSIAGLETRSGDYPVVNTKNVAIIIMLTGLENIPRVGELREIREHYRHPSLRGQSDNTSESGDAISSLRTRGEISDEKIVLPQKMQRRSSDSPFASYADTPRSDRGEETVLERKTLNHGQNNIPEIQPGEKLNIETGTRQEPPELVASPRAMTGDPVSKRGGYTVQHQGVADQVRDLRSSSQRSTEKEERLTPPVDPGRSQKIPSAHSKDSTPKESPRQKVERELERQRIMSTEMRMKKSGPHMALPKTSSATVIKSRQTSYHTPSEQEQKPAPGSDGSSEPVRETEKRTIIISRKKATHTVQDSGAAPVAKQERYIPADEQVPTEAPPEECGSDSIPEGDAIEMREHSFRAKDRVFEGKTVQSGYVPRPRDSALLKGNMHLGRKTSPVTDPESRPAQGEQVQDDAESQKKQEKSIKKKDDISWI
ncbi:MAG: tubulin/FtsZ family protein [Methanoregula sp.]